MGGDGSCSCACGRNSSHFLVALRREVGSSRRDGGEVGGAACLLCVAEEMSQSYKLTGD